VGGGSKGGGQKRGKGAGTREKYRRRTTLKKKECLVSGVEKNESKKKVATIKEKK